MKPLTSRQNLYVTNVLAGLSESQAARKAGYGKAYSYKAAQTIGNIPAVKEAIEKGQANLRERAMYDQDEFIKELDKGLQFGYLRNNPMSIAKFLELKAKLYGLLIERVETVSIDITAALAEAKRRTAITATVEPVSLPSSLDEATASARVAWDPFAD